MLIQKPITIDDGVTKYLEKFHDMLEDCCISLDLNDLNESLTKAEDKIYEA